MGGAEPGRIDTRCMVAATWPPPSGEKASPYDITGGSAEFPAAAAAGSSRHLAVFMMYLFFPCSSSALLGHESPQDGVCVCMVGGCRRGWSGGDPQEK